MKKNLIFSALSICTFMLFSCGNKNNYVITNKNNIEFNDEGEIYKFFGYQNLNIKKGTTYTFVLDFSSLPLKYTTDPGDPNAQYRSFGFGFSVDLNNCSVKLNDRTLKLVDSSYKGTDYEVRLSNHQKFGLGIANHDDICKSIKSGDKLTYTLKANEDMNNITACTLYLD